MYTAPPFTVPIGKSGMMISFSISPSSPSFPAILLFFNFCIPFPVPAYGAMSVSLSPDHNYQGDGIGWLSLTGEIDVDLEMTIGGFKAIALWVKVHT